MPEISPTIFSVLFPNLTQSRRYCQKAGILVSVHADQNILFHSLKSLTTSRQIIGFNDEIVDATFVTTSEGAEAKTDSTRSDTHIAIATNSSLIRVYSATISGGLDTRLLAGHGDTVLVLGASLDGRFLASGSKDRSVRIWTFFASSMRWHCIAVGDGHAESVGALAFSNKTIAKSCPKFIVSGSQDRTIKIWDLDGIREIPVGSTVSAKLKSSVTQRVHEKDINSLDVSQNDMLLVTGSQDKTAKIFEIHYREAGNTTLKQVGTLKGHKRGIWNVKFSRSERLVATASGDKTIKLWTLDDFTCVKVISCHLRIRKF